jgi:hypothetical protein
MMTIIRTLMFTSLLSVSIASARKIENWPYERLFNKADIVVIATSEKTTDNEIQWTEPIFDSQHFVGIDTTLHIQTVLKGSASKVIKVHHYKYARKSTRLEDGPRFISFFSSPVSIDLESANSTAPELKELTSIRISVHNKPEYLVFLKQRDDGNYEPISGQIDPTFSVRALLSVESLKQ